MANLRASLLPPTSRLVNQFSQIGLLAQTRFPMIHSERLCLVRIMTIYGELLLQEGDVERADRFLNGWEVLVRQATSAQQTYLDTITIAGTLGFGASSEAVYRTAGYNEKADRMAARVAIASAPADRSKERRSHFSQELVARYGGYLARMGIPKVGQQLDIHDFAPSRRIEFTVVTKAIAGIVSATLLIGIFGCIVVSLRWRFSKTGTAIPILLMPSLPILLRIIVYGALLPGGVFLVITRIVPWSGHEYAAPAAMHKLIAEFGLLIISLLVLPVLMGARAVRKRCNELNIPTVLFVSRRFLPIMAALLAAFWFIPVPFPDVRGLRWVPGIVAGGLALMLLVGSVVGVLQGIAGRKQYGLFYGTFFRSLIPVFAGVLIFLNLSSGAILNASEEKYLREDCLFDLSQGAFVTAEAQAAAILQQEILEALQELEAMP